MLSEAGTGLARADRSMAEAERNIQELRSMLPHMAARGYATDEVETRISLLIALLGQLKSQRWEIEGQLGQP
jgi:hypothetical protein